MIAVIFALLMMAPEQDARIVPIELPYAPINQIVWGFDITDDDVHCMALNIYFEARGEPVKGQYAVADVVINRTKSARHPNTICEVVFYHISNPRTGRVHACAFAWTCDNMQYAEPQDLVAFKRAIQIANEVLFDPYYEMVVPDATHFHADWARPWWSVRREYVASIGSHIFYD